MRLLVYGLLLLVAAGCVRDRENPKDKHKGQELSAAAKLDRLSQLGFAMSGQSVPLGFDVGRISPTTSKLPKGIGDELRDLFEKHWPSDFFLGSIEFIGPDRINEEHADLYPGLTVIRYGFVCIGSDGAGTMYAYCTEDQRVFAFERLLLRRWIAFSRLGQTGNNRREYQERRNSVLGIT